MAQRERSFWGWGWADKFPDREGRRALGDQAGAVLGFEAGEPAEPPSVDDLALPAPRVDPPEALAALATQTPYERALHAHGSAYPDLVRGFGGDFDQAPDFVAYPSEEADVVRLLDWAADAGVAVVPFGGGTSVVGGVDTGVAGDWRGVVSLDMRRMDAVVEVDAHSQAALIEAGATGPRVAEQLGAVATADGDAGFQLRHYPQSYEFSTFGGWVATRAGGHYATRYTHIDDLVESIRMVSPTGTIETRRLPASGAGPDPNRLMLGSEGALGVITRAWTRIQRRPRYRSKASVRFAELADAVRAVRQVVQAGLAPASCRLLDSREAMLNGVVFDGSHVVLLGFESPELPTKHLLDQAIAICREAGGELPDPPRHTDARATDDADSAAGGRWRQAFFEGPYLQNTMVSLGVVADTFETACTWDRFEALHAAVIQNVRAAMKDACGQGFITCRFTHVYTDGPAPYYTFIAPGTRGQLLDQWRTIKAAASETLADHGATITHHHAVGRTHRDWYHREVGDRLAAALRAVKRELDPAGLLNPGVLVHPRRNAHSSSAARFL